MIREALLEQNFNLENLDFKPHITLARARGNQLKGKKTSLALKNLQFEAKSIDIMESQLSLSIEKYKFIENFEFKDD